MLLRVRERMAHHDASHDVHHVLRVVYNAERILEDGDGGATTPSRDLTEAVRLAALTHEWCDGKYVPCKDEALAALATALTEERVPERVRALVCEVVPRLSFSNRLRVGVPAFASSDARRIYDIVSDADYLEAMGITGIVRTHVFQAVRGESLASATRHIENVLSQCVAHLVTPWGLQEGARRARIMTEAMCEYRREGDAK